MKIEPIKAFTDNYIWALHHPTQQRLCVVDPGDSQPVFDYLEEHQLKLDSILITHYHNDHIGGVKALKQATGARVYGSVHDNLDFVDEALNEPESIVIFDDQYQFEILHVPGHTLGHIAYYEPHRQWLFCGDTLFKAGCGRMFEGEPKQFYQSLQKLAQLPPQTQVYCTHEYTLSNLAFAESVEPDNQVVKQLIAESQQRRKQQQATLPSTIASELASNPFLRCDQAPVIKAAHSADPAAKHDWQIFATIRRLKDNF
ncbi:hydroxyacylglutathione hydrolase [Kangiella sp. TOML190]|uniref:hydroxyacylglutathione hydrolase n=1 Tax=Kangiella sp. TOML190 TaxID=2931351 RepID=UPI00203AEBB8|nr:hydroxyacylglutathione hydrolase [Kangiella sp. TOML190]